jgi:hypothetical protein
MAWAVLLGALLTAVSVRGFPGNDHSFSPSITADARYVVFMSAASNLVGGDTNGLEDVFLLDRQTDTLTRISTNAAGQQANGQNWTPMIAANGRYVAFASNASNLVAGDTNNAADVFRKDLQTGEVVRVSVSAAGAQGTSTVIGGALGARFPAISADGRFVAFESDLAGLVPGYNDASIVGNTFVRDVVGGTTWAIGPSGNLVFDSQPSIASRSITLTGQAAIEIIVAFRTGLALQAGDGNSSGDIYRALRVIPDNSSAAASADWSYLLVSAGISGSGAAAVNIGGNPPPLELFGASAEPYAPVLTADGQQAVYLSAKNNLTATLDDANNQHDLFRVVLNGAGSIASRTSRITNGIGPPTVQIEQAGISANGGVLVWFDRNANLWRVNNGLLPTSFGDSGTQATGLNARVQRFGRGVVSNDQGGGFGNYRIAFSSSGSEPFGTRSDPFEDVFIAGITGISSDFARASSGRLGTAQDGHSRSVAISPDGNVVEFGSHASGFDAADPGANRDVIRRSLTTGVTTRLGSAFGNSSRDFRWPDLASNGRNVFIAELDAAIDFQQPGGAVTRCSDSTSNAWVRYPDGNATCLDLDRPGYTNLLAERVFQPAISDDGRYAAFVGKHADAPFSRRRAVYLVDLDSLEIVTALAMTLDLNPSERTLGLERDTIGLSGNGQYLVFTVTPDSSVGGPNECFGKKVYLYDRVANTSTAVTPLVGGSLATPPKAAWPTISADGNTVALVSCDNLANEASPPAGTKLYHWNRATQVFTRIPTDTLARNGNSVIGRPRLSADARYTAFVVDQNCLDRCVTQQREIALYDRQTRSLRTVSVTPSWSRANGPAGNQDALSFNTFLHSLDLSADGRKLVFSSSADNLTPGDRNYADDVFVLDVPSQTLSRASAFGNNAAGDDDRVAPAISGNATVLAYGAKNRDGAIGAGGSAPLGYAKGSSDKWSDIVINSGSGERVISQAPNGAPSNGDSGEPSITPNGSFVAFQTEATNVTAGSDTNNAIDIVVHNVGANQNQVASVGVGGAAADGPSGQPAVATNAQGDKWSASFTTNATNLTPDGATNGVSQVVLAVQGTGNSPPSNTGISVTGAGAWGNGPSGQSDLSSDATLVSFTSLSTNLIASDTNNAGDIYLRDLVANSTTRISEPPGGGQANGPSGKSSADKWNTAAGAPAGVQWVVVFESDASNLVANDLNGATDVFARLSNGEVRLLSRALGSSPPAPANDRSFAPSLASNGRYVTFSSGASNLVAGDTNGIADMFLYDLATDTLTLVSNTRAGAPSNDVSNSGSVGVNALGQPVVVYDTGADNLAPGDGDNAFDIYVDGGAANADQVGQTAVLAITERVPASTVVGEPYFVVAQVTSPSGPPGGSVAINDGAGSSCNANINAQGLASCQLTSMSAGNRTLGASFLASVPIAYSAAPISQTHPVAKANTTASVSLGTGPFASGQVVTATASVVVVAPGAGTPSGSISVSVSGGGESCTITLPATSCQLALVNVAADRTVTASYAGNATLNASTATSTATVNLAQTIVTLDLPPTLEVGTPVTASIGVGVLAPGAGTPSGVIMVSASATEQCTVTLPATSCQLTLSATGNRTISASFPGTATLAASSTNVARTVVAAGATIFGNGFEDN